MRSIFHLRYPSSSEPRSDSDASPVASGQHAQPLQKCRGSIARFSLSIWSQKNSPLNPEVKSLDILYDAPPFLQKLSLNSLALPLHHRIQCPGKAWSNLASSALGSRARPQAISERPQGVSGVRCGLWTLNPNCNP